VVFSWAVLQPAEPMRLAGTARAYSGRAISQLTRITSGSPTALCLRWPYQAKVMKTFDASSIRTGASFGQRVAGMGRSPSVSRLDGGRGRRPRPGAPFLGAAATPARPGFRRKGGFPPVHCAAHTPGQALPLACQADRRTADRLRGVTGRQGNTGAWVG